MSEAQIHKAILQYLEVALPKAVIHHSPNEVDVRGPDVARAIVKARGMGTRKGFPDLVVFPFAHVGPIFFEVKAKRGALTLEQSAMIERLAALGYKAAVVRSVDDVVDRLSEWGVWREPDVKFVELRGVIR